MGAEEVPSIPRRPVPILAACALLAIGVIAGCGEEDPQANVSGTETLGPASAEGDIEQSSATLRAEDGYTTLVSTQITTRGDEETLVAGQVELPGSSQPTLRLKVDGKVERATEIEVTDEGETRVAVVSCACKFPTGEHVVVLEGTAKGTATVGARTLLVLPEVDLDDVEGSPVSRSTLVTDEVKVTPEGETLAQTPAGEGSGPATVLTAIASPRSETGADNVRLATTIGGDVADELARTTIPSGKLDAYLDENGAGKAVEVRGFTTSGETAVGAASVIVCDCGLER